jgi:hypothetical protein
MSNNNSKSNTGRPTTTHWSSHGGQRVYHTTTYGNASINNGDYLAGGSGTPFLDHLWLGTGQSDHGYANGRSCTGNQAPIPALDNLHVRLVTAQQSGRTHFHPVPLPRVSTTSHATSGKASFNPRAKYYAKPPTDASANTSQPKATRKGSPTQKAGSASKSNTTLVPQEDDDDSDFVDTDSENEPGDESNATQPSQPAESAPSSSTTD